jgi:hypothetical protein
LLAAIERAAELGWRVVLNTYTLSHHQGEETAAVLARLTAARMDMQSQRAWKGNEGFKKRWGWQGTINHLEILYGVNGPHPHHHEIAFLAIGKPLTGDAFQQFRSELRELWEQSVERAGGSAEWHYGVQVSTRRGDLAEYVAKYGRLPADEQEWGVAGEVAKSHLKRSKHGLNWLEILQRYGAAIAQDDWLKGSWWGALFQEYAAAMKGKAHLFWSPGLKAKLGLRSLPIDSPVIEQRLSPVLRTLVELTRDEWEIILDKHLKLMLRQIGDGGDVNEVKKFLRERAGIDVDNRQTFTLAVADASDPDCGDIKLKPKIELPPAMTEQLAAMLETSW